MFVNVCVRVRARARVYVCVCVCKENENTCIHKSVGTSIFLFILPLSLAIILPKITEFEQCTKLLDYSILPLINSPDANYNIFCRTELSIEYNPFVSRGEWFI